MILLGRDRGKERARSRWWLNKLGVVVWFSLKTGVCCGREVGTTQLLMGGANKDMCGFGKMVDPFACVMDKATEL